MKVYLVENGCNSLIQVTGYGLRAVFYFVLGKLSLLIFSPGELEKWLQPVTRNLTSTLTDFFIKLQAEPSAREMRRAWISPLIYLTHLANRGTTFTPGRHPSEAIAFRTPRMLA